MSYTVQFSPVARNQLAELEDYIGAAGSPVVSSRYVNAIVAYCESFAAFPPCGHMRDDLLPGLRITNYRRRTVIAFLVDMIGGRPNL